MALYKIAMNARIAIDKTNIDTNHLLDEMDELVGFSSPPISRASTPLSTSRASSPLSIGHSSTSLSVSRGSTPLSVSTASTSRSTSSRLRQSGSDYARSLPKRQCVEKVDVEFKLPVFSPDIRKCISKDSFYTSTQRNRLIKEACLALCGFCREQEREITNIEKRNLAKLLHQLAPKSLGDPGSVSKPEVRICM